jgi:hypothetical protein
MGLLDIPLEVGGEDSVKSFLSVRGVFAREGKEHLEGKSGNPSGRA